ncbi:MAG: YbjQ family protein [Actinomycetota bacterium]|nr:YbjQ family protein [Actinomycetota bacterium]
MIVTTADVLPGQKVQVLGLVAGNVVTSRHIGRDIMAGFKNIAGGEIKSYTDMMFEGRQIAEQRMVANAQAMGADAVVSMRFDGSSVMEGAIDFLAYGTAVKFVQ